MINTPAKPLDSMAFAHLYLQMSRLMFTIQFLDKFEPPDPHQWQTLVQHDHRDHSPCLPHPGFLQML